MALAHFYQTAAVIDGRIGDMPFTASSRYTHVYVEPVEPQVLVTAQGMEILPG